MIPLSWSTENDDYTTTKFLPQKTVSIIAVGDSIGYNIKHYKLSDLNKIIKGNTEVFIFNLEGVLSDSLSVNSTPKVCKGFPSRQSIFVTQSTFVDYLKLAPITIANLANNHILDCGSKGIKETKEILVKKTYFLYWSGIKPRRCV